jgi:gamma-glutamyltranspeptidase
LRSTTSIRGSIPAAVSQACPNASPRTSASEGSARPSGALALAQLLDGERADGVGDTTNITVVDAEGNACVSHTSLGLGSGDFVPGLDLHLNSMLGEADLLRGSLEPANGWRA